MDGKELLFFVFSFLFSAENIFGASAGSGLKGRVID